MSINFAAISSHPPIIIPEIGSDEDLEKVKQTVSAMKKLAFIFAAAEIDTLVIISPHMLVYPDKFNLCSMRKLFGTFAPFDHPEIMIEANNDLDFLALLQKELDNADLPYVPYNNEGEFFELDHGAMVPLHYLSKNQEFSFRVVPIAYSNLDRAKHFAFGQVLRDVAEKYPGRVGILASGDLSHQLLQNPEGKVFDQKLVNDIKDQKFEDILYYDEELVENAGECGYRSILILLGALSGVELSPEVLSYEGPFGVGYLVANFSLKEKI